MTRIPRGSLPGSAILGLLLCASTTASAQAHLESWTVDSLPQLVIGNTRQSRVEFARIAGVAT
ncbi:MAG: hypothetical protein J0626_01140, partial [Rhodospirillaceae bacterium]|nr:hypothetical protein [Rhodospirillaceae bacterium]